MTATFSSDEKKKIEDLLETGVALSADKLAELSNTPWSIVSTSVEEMPVIKVLTIFKDDATPHLGAPLKSRSMLPFDDGLRAGDDSVAQARSIQEIDAHALPVRRLDPGHRPYCIL